VEHESRAHAGSAMLADSMTGQLLEGRYLIGPRIARGGMASVYEATDTRLDRTCAVKIMHPGLGDDDAFAERFVREARAAARLSHPNVVNVFDQGDDPGVDGGTLFLVMELIPGHTLRDVVRKEAPLSPPKALALIEPVLSALAAAHRAGLIHRDIKPENVLIADDGRVKVADFGLAKAVSADTQHTATGGIIIGTVSYLAPEVVVDGTSDARADVYAVGVVLYELLTGRKPHEGESPIAVAYKHVHEDVPAPSASVPGIPSYVDALVARATSRDRAQRPADASVMLHQVHRVASALAGGVREDLELTTDLAPLKTARTVDDDTSALDLLPLAEPADFVAPPPSAPRGPVHDPGPARRRSRRGPVLLVLALLVALLAGGGAYWFGWARYTATPGVYGMTQQVATHKLEAAGLHVTIGAPAYSETVPTGHVVGTDPGAGSRVLDHGTVTVTLSKGKERYDVPKTHGLTVNQAQDALLGAHLTFGRTIQRWSDTVAKGTVLGSNPAQGARERPQTVVDLLVSNGPRPIHVRDWTGRDVARAQRVMESQHLNVDTSDQQYSDSIAKGHVISQSPVGTTLHRGDTVTLVVSKGPQLVQIPGNLRAMGVDAATQLLESLGFRVEVDHSAFYIGVGYVYSSSPSPGGFAPKGSLVILHII
jgi:serine/threonine protein kinase/beta-lactam-binding protein with PASTA domain